MKTLLFLALLCGVALADDHFDSITTTDGRTYTKVAVKRADPTGIDIVYNDGVAHLKIELLPAELRDKYAFTPEKKKAFYAARDAQIKASEGGAADQVDTWNPESIAKSKGILAGSGVIAQVLNNGVLTTAWCEQIIGSGKDRFKTSFSLARNHSKLIFLERPTDGLIDDQMWSNQMIYPIGTYSYVDTNGAQATVLKFTTDIQTAVEYYSKHPDRSE